MQNFIYMKRLLICIILLSVSSSAFAQTYFQDPSADTLCPDDTVKLKLNPSFAFDSVQWQDSTSPGNANWTSVSFRSGQYKKTNDSIEVYGADSGYTIFLRALFDTTNNNAFDDTSTLKKIQLLSAFSWNDTIQGPQSVCSEDTATYRIDTTETTIDSIRWDTAKTDAQVLAGYGSDSLQIATKPVKNDTIKAVVSSPCGRDSLAIKLNILDSLGATTISRPQTVCFNDSPKKVKLDSVPGDNRDSIVYTWLSAKGSNAFTTIQGANDTVYNPGRLKDTTRYRLKYKSAQGCGIDTTPSVQIGVYEDFLPGTIAIASGQEKDTICYNSKLDTNLYFNKKPSGAGDTFNYQWQRQTKGKSSWKTVGKNDTFYTPKKLKSTALYRVRVTAVSGCDSALTDSVRIQVLDSLNSGVVGNDQVICFSQRPDSLKFTQDPKGGGNKFTYQWQKDQLSNGNWNDITSASANAASYRPSNLGDTTSYRALVRTKAGCGPDTTNSVKINVLDSFSVGPLTGDTTICYNDPPDAVEITNVEGGGDAFKYQWQTLNQQGVWNTVTTSKTRRYSPGQLKDSVEYRAVVSTDTTRCGVDTTNEIEIGVYDPIKSGSIKGKDSICFGRIPNTLRLKDSAQGGGGAFNYQWLAKSGASSYKPAPRTPNTKINYSPGNLTESSQYKLTFTSKAGCGVDTSGSLDVTVFDKLAKPSIIGSDTICFKANPGKLLLKQSLSGGGGGYRYTWQDSVRGKSWSTNKTGDTFLNPDPLRTTTSYRLRVTSAFGCRQFSNQSTVKVYDSLNSGQIIGDTTICFNTQPQTLKFGTNPSGGGDRYSYQWRQRSDQASEYDSAGSGLAFQPSSQSDTNLYQVVVKSLEGCGFDTTNRVKVEVFPELRAPSITFSDQVSADTICQQEQPDSIIVQQTTKGGAKPYNYSWQRQTDDDNQWEIESTQDKKQIKPGNLVDTATYRLSITSSRQCGTVVSNTLNTIVNPLPKPITLEGDQFICRNAKDKSYTFREPVNGHFYRWDIDGGEILEGRWSSNITVDWSAQRSSDSLYLYDSITRTGCTRYSAFPITKSQFRAPDRTDVIRKPNSSILVAADSSEGLQYRWGYDFKNSDSSVVLDDADNRYAQFPEPFDSSRLDYWVKTFYTYNGDTCSTKTYLEPRQYSNIQIAGDQQSSIKVYPNPTKGQLTVEGTQLSRWQVKVLDQNGKPVDVSLIGDQIYFRSNLPEGLYLLYLKSDHNIITRKILLLK
jgi:hypothetical protein